MHWIQSLGTQVLQSSIAASAMIAVVLTLRMLMGHRILPRWLCWIWLLVGIRLLLPGWVGVPLHLADWMHSATAPELNGAAHLQASEAGAMQISVEHLPLIASRLPTSGATGSVDLLWLLAIVWLAGAVFLLLRQLHIHRSLSHRIRQMEVLTDMQVIAVAADCARRLGVRRTIRVVQSDLLRSPAMFGIFTPTIILPSSIDLNHDQLRLILLHELAHVRNCDALIQLIVSIIRSIHWFNPLVWMASAAHRADRELLCDSTALCAMTPSQRQHYAGCLMTIIERICQTPAHPAAIGVFGSRRTIQRRITMISHFESKPRYVVLSLLMMTIIGCTAVTTPARPENQSSFKAEQSIASVDVQEDARSQETRLALAKLWPEDDVLHDNMPLEQALQAFARLSNTSVFVNWKELEAGGVGRDTPVNARLRNVTFAKYLKTILENAGGSDVQLGYAINEGVITIARQETLDQNSIVTQVYDIRDLLVNMDIFEAGASTQPATSDRAQIVKQIIGLIRDTIEPNSWRENGGTVGSIREISGQLVVTQTPEHHNQIRQLLVQLRESRAIQISIEARMMLIDTDKMPKDIGDILRPLGGEKAVPTVNYLADEQVSRVIKSIQQVPGATTISAPRVTIFNGQRASVRVTTETAYIASIAVQRRADGTTSYEPVLGSVSSGVVFDVQGTASADRKYVTLTLKPKLITLKGMTSEPYQAHKDLFIQKPELEEQELQTTASVPDQTTLVMRASPTNKDGRSMLFIFIKPTLIIKPSK